MAKPEVYAERVRKHADDIKTILAMIRRELIEYGRGGDF